MPSTVYSWDNIDLDDEHLCEGTAASLADYRSIQSGRSAATGPSKATGGELLRSGSNDLQTRLDSAVAEIESFEAEIERQRAALAELSSCRDALIEEVENLRAQLSAAAATGISQRQSMASKGKSRAITLSDYTTSFEWTDTLKAKMRSIFKIQNFRLCQEGVCNANLDGRDIVCVMPTGGGKSLTYQLPALISPGCTLVISPLISLMTDQILHLRDAGVEAVMITGSTPKEQSREIRDRLTAMARRQGSSGPDIKLLYVTPEKIAKDKSLLPLLEKLDHAKALARLVIDEAHCVSEMGHDYRPDYQKLSVLRKLFPNIPILALSATCPPRVLRDLLNILQMQQPLQKPTSAANHGTIHFQAPLYRKNLHYTIVRKPSSHADHIKAMKEYILEHHEDQSGIIYCLSKKDAETVAQDLEVTSDHRIKTGVYHADIGDSRKEALHKQWRRGAVKVICATIAFGLGIDKGDVRFVIHHSIPKSVEGFYQESGRAGRDGKDADCVLYYRPQDATRLTQLTVGERGASEKLHDMLRFVQNMEECRKVQFAKYFRASSQLEIASWTTDEEDALARCGHCDNCTRAPDALVRQDVRVPAWQILQVARAVQRNDGRVTIATLSDLVRGLGNATINVASGKRKGRAKESETIGLDLDAIAGGKVNLSKEDTEWLCVHLLTSRYLEESYASTAFRVNAYVIPGTNAIRLSRFSQDDLEQGKGPALECCFPGKPKRKTNKQDGLAKDGGPSQTRSEIYPDEREVFHFDNGVDYRVVDTGSDDELEGEIWRASLRDEPVSSDRTPPRKKARTSSIQFRRPATQSRMSATQSRISATQSRSRPSRASTSARILNDDDDDVIYISSD